MLKKYIKLFLESSSFQTKNTTNPSYLDIAKQVEDEQRIKDLEASKIKNNTQEEMSAEEYSNLLNYYNQSYIYRRSGNRIPRNYLFNQRPPKKKT